MKTATRELRAGLYQVRLRYGKGIGIPLVRGKGKAARGSLAMVYRSGRNGPASAKRQRSHLRRKGLV